MKYTFDELCEIVKTLRSDHGCPWDREQTIPDLKNYVLEESYEVIDACNTGGMKLADELGDLLLQIVMIAEIASEEKSFDITDVISLVSEKMIHRHPHVFADATADTSAEVLDNWEKIKKNDRKIDTTSGVMRDIASAMPALLRAYKVQGKAAKVNFDWDTAEGAAEKLSEEISEVLEAERSKTSADVCEEVGDMLFSAVNVARKLKVNPELALTDATEKFISRFEKMENLIKEEDKNIENMSLSELDIFWERVKNS